MHPFHNQVQLAVNYLKECMMKIETINAPEFDWVKTKILTDLKAHVNMYELQLGVDSNKLTVTGGAAAVALTHRKPLTKLFGKEIPKHKTMHVETIGKFSPTSAELEAEELTARKDELTLRFVTDTPDMLLDQLNDDEIRMVAKSVELPFTDTEPKRITIVDVAKIKEAIHNKLTQRKLEKEANGNQPKSPVNMDENDKKFLTDDERDAADVEQFLTDDKKDTGGLIADQKQREAMDPEKAAIYKIYDEFLKRDNKEIIDCYEDIQIRGVAKIAGLPVTETTPPKVTSKFVDQIKEAIKLKSLADPKK